MQLRDYQQDAVNSTLRHFRKSNDPAVISLPTGSGKSLIIAELAKLANHPVLVLAHVKELVEQNHSKYENYGLKAGVFAAGLGKKQDEFKVTFASVQSLSRNLEKFNGFFSLLIIDECHRVSDNKNGQYQKVITHLKKQNSSLKILGLTATPYRLDKGWVYQKHYHGYVRTEEKTPFTSCIYELPLRYLIKKGYLTNPILIDAPVARYKFEDLPREYNEAELDKFLSKSPRVTQAICNQLIELAKQRKGVMIFAASIKHAQEIFEQLPEHQAVIVTGKTTQKERDKLLNEFKRLRIKFLVNVSVLTTGFDAPHVDLIAILRRTGSVSLFQQCVGRGLRLADGKKDCLVIDYAGNGYDVYQPEIGLPKPNPNSSLVQVPCPNCNHANIFWGITDSDGDIIEHYGRRCQGLITEVAIGIEHQCKYRFKYKQCHQCNAENDIAGRECFQCHAALIDPDNQLKNALNLKDRKVLRCSGMSATAQQNKINLIYHDEDGAEIKETFYFNANKKQQNFFRIFTRTVTGAYIEVNSAAQLVDLIHEFVAPDFVIAKKEKYYWKVENRIFDYKGAYRKANKLY